MKNNPLVLALVLLGLMLPFGSPRDARALVFDGCVIVNIGDSCTFNRAPFTVVGSLFDGGLLGEVEASLAAVGANILRYGYQIFMDNTTIPQNFEIIRFNISFDPLYLPDFTDILSFGSLPGTGEVAPNALAPGGTPVTLLVGADSNKRTGLQAVFEVNHLTTLAASDSSEIIFMDSTIEPGTLFGLIEGQSPNEVGPATALLGTNPEIVGIGSGQITGSFLQPVPEPGTLLLLGSGLLVLGGFFGRRRHRVNS